MTGLKGKTFLFVLLGLMLNFTLLFVLVMTGKFAFLFVSEPTVKYYIRLVVKVCALKSENGFIIELNPSIQQQLLSSSTFTE